MQIEIHLHKFIIAEIKSEGILVHNAQDAVELIFACFEYDTDKIILQQKNLPPDFFDLKTGLAGEILQKFSTYQAYLAIVGNFSNYSSKSLKDFIFESNKQGRINFVATMEEAIEKLSR